MINIRHLTLALGILTPFTGYCDVVTATSPRTHHLIEVGYAPDVRWVGDHVLWGDQKFLIVQPAERHRLKYRNVAISTGSHTGTGDSLECMFTLGFSSACDDVGPQPGQTFDSYTENAVMYQYRLSGAKAGSDRTYAETWIGLGSGKAKRTTSTFTSSSATQITEADSGKGVAWEVDVAIRHKYMLVTGGLQGNTRGDSYGFNIGFGLGF